MAFVDISPPQHAPSLSDLPGGILTDIQHGRDGAPLTGGEIVEIFIAAERTIGYRAPTTPAIRGGVSIFEITRFTGSVDRGQAGRGRVQYVCVSR